MMLLARDGRQPCRAERGLKEDGRRQAWSFDAIRLLDKKLRAPGVRRCVLPPEEG